MMHDDGQHVEELEEADCKTRSAAAGAFWASRARATFTRTERDRSSELVLGE